MGKKLIGYMFLLSFVFVNTAEAQFKDLKKLNPLGGGDEQESPVDVEGAQAKLLDDLADALGDVYAAQANCRSSRKQRASCNIFQHL